MEFRVNSVKTDYPMKLGDGGEAFFVFETSHAVPADMQTSPLVSPSASPRSMATVPDPTSLQEPDYLNIAETDSSTGVGKDFDGLPLNPRRAQSDFGMLRSLGTVAAPHLKCLIFFRSTRKSHTLILVIRTYSPSKR